MKMKAKKYRRVCSLLIAVMILFAVNALHAGASEKNSVTKIRAVIGNHDVTKKTYKMSAGGTVKLHVHTRPKKAAGILFFRSSAPEVVSVSKSGKIRALKNGNARVTFTVSGKKYKKTSSFVKTISDVYRVYDTFYRMPKITGFILSGLICLRDDFNKMVSILV